VKKKKKAVPPALYSSCTLSHNVSGWRDEVEGRIFPKNRFERLVFKAINGELPSQKGRERKIDKPWGPDGPSFRTTKQHRPERRTMWIFQLREGRGRERRDGGLAAKLGSVKHVELEAY